jgi:hypothetical protein
MDRHDTERRIIGNQSIYFITLFPTPSKIASNLDVLVTTFHTETVPFDMI